jgi:O-glycosyl hydrolase
MHLSFKLKVVAPLTAVLFGLVAGSAYSQAPAVVTVRIDAKKTYQTIANFGASDAWSCQFVGNWPAAKKDAIADLLFSQESGPNGQPKGIGLSQWRFNIGAGSAEQGEQSGIKDEWRRAESFLKPDGSYDWTHQAGQQWFLKAAQQRGVKQFLGFLNSPPVQLTANGKAYATKAATNIAPTNYAALGTFIAKVVAGVKQTTGITFDYVSPINEPQWDWSDGGQEGSPFRNEEMAGVVKALSSALVAERLPSKILITEAGKLDYLLTTGDKPNRGNQLAAFFGDKAAPTYLGNTPQVAPVLAGHSYFTTSPASQAVALRRQLAARVAAVDKLTFWQSEYCILGDNGGEINGNPRDLSITPALYLARVIHHDLAVANAAAWQWWLAVSPYNYKDGLIYIDKNKTDGTFQSSKMLWALGNYSRYIRPGAVRVAATLPDSSASQLLVSAYRSPNSKQLVTVVINDAATPADLRLELSGRRLGASQAYTTTATTDLQPGAPVPAGQVLHLAPRSITTLVSELR